MPRAGEDRMIRVTGPPRSGRGSSGSRPHWHETSETMEFLDTLKEKVLIFDGAMGTSIHKYELSLDDYRGCENCPEILVESRPDVVAEIHAAYLKAGCDAIETDTFGGSPVVLAEFGLSDRAYQLNWQAAELARGVAADFS